jgi:hypothetical protein
MRLPVINRLAMLSAAAVALCVLGSMPFDVGRADDEATPIFGIKMFPGYRDWRLISVAHEAGKLDDLRAILGNDIAIQAYREGKQAFPDGTVIARLAWAYTPSEEKRQGLRPAASPHLWRNCKTAKMTGLKHR